MCINVSGEHANLLECRRKTELVAVLMKHGNVGVSFTDNIAVTLKVGSKPTTVQFMRDPTGGEDGLLKGTKVKVSAGMDKNSST